MSCCREGQALRWRPRLLALSTSLLVGAGAMIGGASLNTQLPGKPDELLAKVMASLAKQG